MIVGLYFVVIMMFMCSDSDCGFNFIKLKDLQQTENHFQLLYDDKIMASP